MAEIILKRPTGKIWKVSVRQNPGRYQIKHGHLLKRCCNCVTALNRYPVPLNLQVVIPSAMNGSTNTFWRIKNLAVTSGSISGGPTKKDASAMGNRIVEGLFQIG